MAHDPETAERRERLFRFQTNLLDAVRQAVVATDLDGRIIFWNRAAEALFGWSRDEALAAELLDFDAPTETRQKTLEVLSALRTGESWSGEMVLQHRDGSQFPAMVTGSPVPDPDGEFTGIVGIVTDLSDVKETEAALRERVKELRTLYRASRIINRHDIPMTERLEELVGLLPGGWLYPRLTETRIALNGMVVHSDGFRVTPWMQTATVHTDGTRLGQIDVALTEQRPDRDEGPFLAEERDLLDNLARLIGDAAERDRLTRLLEQTFASLDVAVVIVDSRDGGRGILDVNPAAERSSDATATS